MGHPVTDYVAPSIGTVLATLMFLSPMRAVLEVSGQGGERARRARVPGPAPPRAPPKPPCRPAPAPPSPLPPRPAPQVRKTGDLGAMNPLPFPVITANCLLWVGYAYNYSDWFLFFANTPGVLLGLFYTLVCYGRLEGPRRAAVEGSLLGGVGVAAAAGWAAVVGFPGSESGRGSVVGGTAVAVLSVYYAAPLSTFAEVVRSRDASSILYPLATCNLVNGVAWFVYGLFALADPFVWAPNGLGSLLAVASLALRARYGARPRGGPAACDGSTGSGDTLEAGKAAAGEGPGRG